MRNRVVRGIIAGTAGTVALDAATYADMALRGRGSSGTPASLVGVIADKLGIMSLASAKQDEATGNRRSGVGALLGYATGLGVGMAYGLVRGRRTETSLPAGLITGLAAMAGGTIRGQRPPRLGRCRLGIRRSAPPDLRAGYRARLRPCGRVAAVTQGVVSARMGAAIRYGQPHVIDKVMPSEHVNDRRRITNMSGCIDVAA